MKKIFTMISIVFLIGCAAELAVMKQHMGASATKDASMLHMGMSRQNVSNQIGDPERVSRRASGEEIWTYYYNPFGKVGTSASSISSQLTIMFVNGKVTNWQTDQ